MALFSRRVPLYVFLPVIVGCGAAGYVASTWRPQPANKHSVALHTADTGRQPSETSVVADTAAEPARPQLATASSPVQDIVPPAALPIGEIDLPTPAEPAAKAAERRETHPDDNVRAGAGGRSDKAPNAGRPILMTTSSRRRPPRPARALPRQHRAEPAVRTTSKARHRTDRQRTAGPAPLRQTASVAFRSSGQCFHSCNSSRPG